MKKSSGKVLIGPKSKLFTVVVVVVVVIVLE